MRKVWYLISLSLSLSLSHAGEGVIFGIAVAILAFEVSRQKEKEKKKEEAEQAFIDNLENRINELTFAAEELDTKLREVTRIAYATQHELKGKQVCKLAQIFAFTITWFFSYFMGEERASSYPGEGDVLFESCIW